MALAVDQLKAALVAGRNADGGWGYYPGKASRLEPTCWALLALPEADPEVLRKWPAVDGLLLERSGGQPNFAFHGLGLITLRRRSIEHWSGNPALLNAIQNVKGEAFQQNDMSRQNNALQGWSWIPGTFSWVEPTAWCLLALKKWRSAGGVRVDAKRLTEAEAVLVDRCCRDGGWNYGTSNVLGKEHSAYVPTTAVALLALQDRRSESVFSKSLDYLKRLAASEQSGLALSLAIVALRCFAADATPAETALVAQVPTSISLGNQLAEASSLFALRSDHGDAVFAV